MEPLGLRFGSLTTERSANYILSLPAEAPEYFNEVSNVTTNGHRERLCQYLILAEALEMFSLLFCCVCGFRHLLTVLDTRDFTSTRHVSKPKQIQIERDRYR